MLFVCVFCERLLAFNRYDEMDPNLIEIDSEILLN